MVPLSRVHVKRSPGHVGGSSRGWGVWWGRGDKASTPDLEGQKLEKEEEEEGGRRRHPTAIPALPGTAGALLPLHQLWPFLGA